MLNLIKTTLARFDEKKIVAHLLFLSIFPLIAFKTYSSIFTIVLFIYALIDCLKNGFSVNLISKKTLVLVLGIFLTPFVATGISQLIRGSIDFSAFDGPSRFIFAIPLFFFLTKKKYSLIPTLGIATSSSLIFLFFYVFALNFHLHGEIFNPVSGNRMTLPHIDAIIFGNFAMLMGLLSFFSCEKSTKQALRYLLLIGMFIGWTLSYLSLSRSGWIGGLIVFIIYATIRLDAFSISRKNMIIYFTLIVLFLIIEYIFIGALQSRIENGISDVRDWITGKNLYSSVGTRLSMWKLSVYLFLQHPLSGYADKAFDSSFLSDQTLLTIGGIGGVETIYCCGPHNEFLAHILRSGIFGIITYISMYFLPLYLFSKKLSDVKHNQAAAIGICVTTFLVITGQFSEMISLKFTYTFYALMLSILLSTSLKYEK